MSPTLRAVALVCIATAIPSAGCGNRGESRAEAADVHNSFPVTSPIIKDVVIRREYVADIRAARHAEVRSRIQGILESVSVDEGQRVKAGQILFTINARARKQAVVVAKAELIAAGAELHATQLELDNTQLLTDKNIVSAAELNRAKSKVEVARAKVEEARANVARAGVELDHADVKAPFDGIVNRVPRKAGSAVGENELLTTITDASDVLAYFSITEREYLAFSGAGSSEARKVKLLLADGTPFSHDGEVDAIGSEFDPETGTLAYRARFPNPEGVLKHGSSGKVVLETKLAGALLIPQKATFEVQGDVYVYTVDATNVAHARKLKIKQRLDDAFIIETGLMRTDRFVLEGIQQVKDGAHIEPRAPDTATSRRG